MANKRKVVIIGGGTGTTAVLLGLKKYKDLCISVIVSMTDDGGSNAVVRDEFGLLPLSDLRKSILHYQRQKTECSEMFLHIGLKRGKAFVAIPLVILL